MTIQFFHILQQTGFSKSPKIPLSHISKLCALWAVDIAPILDVPTLFFAGAFLLKTARLLQWLVFIIFFVWPQTLSCMYHFYQTSLVSTVFTRFTLSPCFSQKLFEIIFSVRLNFFRRSATFFELFKPSNGPIFSFFDFLQQTKVPKSPKGLHFFVFWHYEYIQHSHFSLCFENFKKDDFVVSKGSPFIFALATNWIFKKLEWSPF